MALMLRVKIRSVTIDSPSTSAAEMDERRARALSVPVLENHHWIISSIALDTIENISTFECFRDRGKATGPLKNPLLQFRRDVLLK